MKNKVKARTIESGTWERKKYIQQCRRDLLEDILTIRLRMCNLRMNYKKEPKDIMCPICRKMEDTTEHVLQFGTELEESE